MIDKIFTYRNLMGIGLLIMIPFITIDILTTPSFEEELLEAYGNLKQVKVKGIVQRKDYDERSLNYKIITLLPTDGETEFFLRYDKSGLYEFVTIGDSITKNPGSYDVRVVSPERKDTIFALDYGVDPDSIKHKFQLSCLFQNN